MTQVVTHVIFARVSLDMMANNSAPIAEVVAVAFLLPPHLLRLNDLVCQP